MSARGASVSVRKSEEETRNALEEAGGEEEHVENAIIDILVVATMLMCIFVAYIIVSKKINK